MPEWKSIQDGYKTLNSMEWAMEKNMNLISMVLLFVALAGFDHFYQSVIQHQKNKTSPQIGLENKLDQKVGLVGTRKNLLTILQ